MSRCIVVCATPRPGAAWIGRLFDSHPDALSGTKA
jgi:hypothetical protein